MWNNPPKDKTHLLPRPFFWKPSPVVPIKSRLASGKPLYMKHAGAEKNLGLWSALLASLHVPFYCGRGTGNDFWSLEWSLCCIG